MLRRLTQSQVLTDDAIKELKIHTVPGGEEWRIPLVLDLLHSIESARNDPGIINTSELAHMLEYICCD